MRSNRNRLAVRVGSYIGFWTIMALIVDSEGVVTQNAVDMNHPISWGVALSRSFKTWYLFGFLSLAVIWFSGRNLLGPGRTVRWLAGHLAALAVYCVAYISILAWLVAGDCSVQTGQILTFSYLFKHYWAHYCFTDTMMYMLVVMAHMGWHYYQQSRHRELEAADLQRELVEARLDALRMQLNPHFLFNTLHAVSALIHDQPEAADRVLARLSDLLRLSLDTSRAQEVPLAEEIAFLDLYLEIEQTRFADRLRVRREIAPDTQA